MLSPPAIAKRFHTLEAYYAHIRANGGSHVSKHSRRTVVRQAYNWDDTTWEILPAPVPYQYAIGNSIGSILGGALSDANDRFCQPMTLEYLNKQGY